MDNVDPSQFLAQDQDEEHDDHDKSPILASLGLTHISQVLLQKYLLIYQTKTHKIDFLKLTAITPK